MEERDTSFFVARVADSAACLSAKVISDVVDIRRVACGGSARHSLQSIEARLMKPTRPGIRVRRQYCVPPSDVRVHSGQTRPVPPLIETQGSLVPLTRSPST